MSMFARLFLLIGLVSGVSLSIVAGLLWRNSVELERQLRAENALVGTRVLNNGTRLLEQNLRNTHLMILQEKAHKVEAYLDNIAGAVQLETELTRQFLTDAGTPRTAPPLFPANKATRMARANPQLRKTLFGVKPYAIYHLAPGVTEAGTSPARNRLRRLGGFFAHTQNTIPGCDSVYLGTEEGFILGYPGAVTLFNPSYDPRKRDWYKQTIHLDKLSWIVNLDRDKQSLMLTCSNAVTLPGQTKPVGVVAIDVKLPNALIELFNVGELYVSKGILVDDIERVRANASYNNSQLSFDKNIALAMPPVSKLPEKGFAHALARIRSTPDTDAEIYWEGSDKGVEMVKAKNVFICAKVRFSTGAQATKPSTPGNNVAAHTWYYIVQLPMDSLMEPITNVSGEINGATKDISQAIKVRTQKSAALVLGLIGATLLVALTVAYFAARATSRPLMQMAGIARGVGEGNLEQQAPENSGGEIGEMGRAINAMINGLRQRNLLKETLGLYVSRSVAEEVLSKGGVQLGGVSSTATVFFSDLEGFTKWAEKTPPEILVPMLNQYLDAMTKVILDSEGTLDKYIGDAILAFWGEPVAHEDDAARACRVALEQRTQLRLLCEQWADEGLPPLNMRIGIETGEVTVGNIGSASLKFNYTVLGDTVNFASRLESVNKVYGTRIMIGERTRRLAGDAIEVRELDLLAVAGKEKPVRVYELLGMDGTLSPTQRQGYDHYEKGLAAYRERQWDEAKDHLTLAQQTLGTDKPSAFLLERVGRYQHNAPPAHWDGSLIMEHK